MNLFTQEVVQWVIVVLFAVAVYLNHQFNKEIAALRKTIDEEYRALHKDLQEWQQWRNGL